jgi:hypothetical protein
MKSELFTDLAPPKQGQVFQLAHSATAARYEIPPQWRQNAMVTFTAISSNLYVAFGDAGVKVSATKVAVAVGETLTPNWGSGFIVPAGASVPWPIDPSDTHFSVVSDGAVGYWTVAFASGYPHYGERLDWARFGRPLLWLDAGRRETLTLDSGAITVSKMRCRANGYEFTESTNKPDWFDATTVGTGLVRPALSFVAGSSEKLVSTDPTLAAALGSSAAFTLVIAVRRTATAALHTVLSVGTTASNNGRWDFTLNASDDPIVTRVTSGGASTNSTYATTINGFDIHVLTFDGTTPLYWLNRTQQTLTGTAAGDVGTTTKVAIGCRAYNTSTADQFASCELSEVIVFSGAMTTPKLDDLLSWLKRRYGK